MKVETLRVSEEESDLGVVIHSRVKPSRRKHKDQNRMLGLIKRTIANTDHWVRLYLAVEIALVRLLQKYM